MSTNEQNPECPLCLELLEMDDVNFFPCTCGYQICRFCWHRIRTDENGLCPACRKQYPEDPADFKPLTPEEMQQIKNEKKQKDIQRKQKISENRKHLSNVRVVQKNLVFVVGLPTRLADSEVLKKCDYFGKFGKILKVIVNQSTSYAGSQGPSASAYVTYHKVEDALRAIQSVNNSKVDGRTLKASLGTTKYCSHFLKKLQCPKQDCMYLHELGDEAASFTKEEMQLGKHQEYEQKLYEQMMNCTNLNRKQISPGDQTDISQFLQKEKWPSPHANKEDHRPNGLSESLGYSQSLQNNLKVALDSSVSYRIKHTSDTEHSGCPQEHSPDRGLQHHLASHFGSSSIREGYPKSEVECSNTNCAPTDQNSRHSMTKDLIGNCSAANSFKSVNAISNQCPSAVHTFDKYSLGNSLELLRQKQQTLSSGTELKKLNFPLQQCRSSSPTPQNTCLPNGILHSGFLPELTLRSREDFKYLTRIPVSSPSKPAAAFSQPPHESNYNNSLVHHGNIANMCPIPQFQHNVPSNHEVLNHSNTVSSSSDYVNNCDSGLEDNFQEVQDDDLGFDPYHESSKGLADLMKKEAGERVEVNSVLPNMLPLNALERTIQSDTVPFQNSYDYTRYLQRMAPPPGFTANHYGANYMPRPSFSSDAFNNKMMHTINMHNHTSASAPMMHYQQQNAHPLMNVASHIVHVPDSGMRPHTQEFQENVKQTLLQNSVNHSFGLQASNQLPLPIGRTSHKGPHWNNSVPSDMQWFPQEQAMLNQACFTENRPVSPSQWLKMFQQMKLNDGSVRYQNHQVQNSTPFAYKGNNNGYGFLIRQ